MDHDSRLPLRSALEARIAADHDDMRARLELAEHFIRKRDWDPAFAQMLEVVRRDRGHRKAALERIEQTFALAGDAPQVVAEWRAKLREAVAG